MQLNPLIPVSQEIIRAKMQIVSADLAKRDPIPAGTSRGQLLSVRFRSCLRGRDGRNLRYQKQGGHPNGIYP